MSQVISASELRRLREEGKTYREIGMILGTNRESARRQVIAACGSGRQDAPPVQRDGLHVEQWRPVVGWENFYEVSDRGRVWSCPRIDQAGRTRGGHLLRARVNGHTGRFEVGLCEAGQVVTRTVHTLVLEAFVGQRPDGFEGCHGPGGPLDNRWPENLYWATRSRNQGADKRRDGTYGRNRGERNGWSKLAEADVRAIRARHAQGVTPAQMAADYGVRPSAVRDVIRGRTWNWLKDEAAA